MKVKYKIILSVIFSFLAIMAGVGLGSIKVPPSHIINIIANKIFSLPLHPDLQSSTALAIIWKLRLPRTLLAFLVGGAVAVSGSVMQSVLKNPLASSYTLGVSSGASLGAALVIVTGFNIPFLGVFTLPVTGLVFGMATVFSAVKFAAMMDKSLETNTIILVGMVFSLFVNAILTLVTAMARDHLAQLTFWQMGSFSLKDWSNVIILFPIVLIGVILIQSFSKEMDIMTFGEDQAFTMGVDVHKVKWSLLSLSAGLTGSAISFVGVIGFIDLIAPHVVRKIFGSSHKIVIPMSMFFGGSFMVICDLIARTIVSPSELPVGAITALIGAPFFAYVYFSRRRWL
ncbi:MAG TPA: iron ABC transporter permease [Sedimentibacter sp.]|jgi:iron complex transport system permease protein|nr:iron ABC transporter permease [Sedimentibacter sp.]HOK50019.1 iron ABC transporter permease [Sedimentibacter sp.]HOW23974.1 iron ABC transporter permease [Sedimentibacter sp.]HRC81019.1 iron ABC transporter permease [Sedimentibacter sp.]